MFKLHYLGRSRWYGDSYHFSDRRLLFEMCSRKDYLKRYLNDSTEKKGKKRKGKQKTSNKCESRFKIVDGDVDIRELSGKAVDIIDDCGDEGPVIAGVIDERPEHVKIEELYDSLRWKKVDSQVGEDFNCSGESATVKGGALKICKPLKSSYSKYLKSEKAENIQSESGSDLSPGRLISHCKYGRHNVYSELKATSDFDVSLPRKIITNASQMIMKSLCNSCREPNMKSVQNKYDNVPYKSDEIRNFNFMESDKKNFKPNEYEINENSVYCLNIDSDGDLSPQRITNGSKSTRSQIYLKQKQSNKSYCSEGDMSPELCKKTSRSSQSSNKNLKCQKHSVPDTSNVKRDLGYDNNGTYSRGSIVGTHICEPKHLCISNSDKRENRMSILSGMKTGLQDVSVLKKEMLELKNREKNMHEIMDEMSGHTAESVLRDRSTGKRRNLKEERLKQKEKEKNVAEQQEKFMEWGKGLRQKEEREKKFNEDLYEMTKPLARYCDDEDLERSLKEQLHGDDPMFDYMLRKKKKQLNTLIVPVYGGLPAPPNRFSIKPGFRWDGVDRSNGYEKKCFGKQNEKKALDEEGHKWSIQNM